MAILNIGPGLRDSGSNDEVRWTASYLEDAIHIDTGVKEGANHCITRISPPRGGQGQVELDKDLPLTSQ